jgi:GT2 family glycosyltransferase
MEVDLTETQMVVDVIILSNGKTKELQEMTQQTIDSCHASEEHVRFNILVYEQKPFVQYKKAKTVHYTEDFHYNRLMNRGIKETSNPWVCLCNNDLYFHKGWAKKCISAMAENNYLSVSPNHVKYAKKDIREGYRIGVAGEVKGWCLFLDRKLINIIGKLDESVTFWYSDNVYADQLKEKKIKHALIRHAYVQHLESVTLNQSPQEVYAKLTKEQEEVYNKKTGAKYAQYARMDKEAKNNRNLSKRRDSVKELE